MTNEMNNTVETVVETTETKAPKMATALKKMNISWTVKQLVKMFNNNKIKTDSEIQRAYEWDNNRKSMLIESILMGYPVPPVYATKGLDGKYDIFDGKQRLSTFSAFLNNEFKLTGIVSDIACENSTGDMQTYKVNGCKFEELDEELRDVIEGFSMTLYYYEDISLQEKIDMFIRINNGQPLNPAVLTRAKAKDYRTLVELGKHELYEMLFSEKDLLNAKNTDLVLKTLIMAESINGNAALGRKELNTLSMTRIFSEEDCSRINHINDVLLEMFTRLESEARWEVEDDTIKALKRPVHMSSIIPFIEKMEKDGYDTLDFISFVTYFFAERENGVSRSFTYNETCNNSTNTKVSVRTRYEATEVVYEDWKEHVYVRPTEFDTVEENEETKAEEVEKAEVETKAVEEIEKAEVEEYEIQKGIIERALENGFLNFDDDEDDEEE